MSNELEQWQWVDEDPFDRLIRARKESAAVSSPAQPPLQFSEPMSLEDVAVEDVKPAAAAAADHSPAPTVPLDWPKNLELSARSVPQSATLAGITPPAVNSPAVPAAPAAPVEQISFAHEFDLAVSLEKMEQWEAAADAFRHALVAQPGRAEALVGLGACLLHIGGAEEALSCFEQCLDSKAERERALLGKAVALQKLTRYEKADRAYREFLQLSPDSPEGLANMIALSVARRDNAAVGEYAHRLLRQDPRSKAALQGLATLAIWKGDQAEAVQYCTRLVEIDPMSFEGWHNLAFAKQKMRPAAKAMRSIA
jgi:tetratricopeptide (TPR) repeat protein